MSIYNCPCCGQKGFTPFTKAMAGTMNAKGKPCKSCGKRCVNGKAATTFNALFSVLIFICFVTLFLISQNYDFLAQREFPLMLLMIIAELVVPRVINAFCFKMTESIRLDF